VSRIGALAYRLLDGMPGPVTARLQAVSAASPRTRRLLRHVSAPMRTGIHRIAHGPAVGMRIDVDGSRPSYVLGTVEPEVQAFMSEHVRPGAIVYDLGANIGYFTLVAASLVGRQGRVLAYEPAPAIASVLRRNVALNGLEGQVTVVEAAVSHADGAGPFDPSANDQSGRLGGGPLRVRTVSLDSEVRRGAPVPDFLKIDVEGAELAALQGMRATLEARLPIVVCEIHAPPDLQGPLPVFLRELGYAVWWLEGDVDGTTHWAPHLVAARKD
jgi:FkbM family methyltransferase